MEKAIEDFLAELASTRAECRELRQELVVTRDETRRIRELLERVLAIGPQTPVPSTPGRQIANAAVDVFEALQRLNRKKGK